MIKSIGIDLGSKITAYMQGEGIIFREPSCIALDINTMESVAYGSDAVALYERLPGCFSLIETVFEGRITDYEKAAELISVLFKKYGISKYDLVLAISNEINEAEMRALVDIFTLTKVRSIGFVDIPTACVLGSNEPLDDNRALLSVNIGSGLTEIGLVKGCRTKYVHTVKYGCAKLDNAIASYFRKNDSVNISTDEIRNIRENVGSVHANADRPDISVRAIDSITGLPMKITVSSEMTRNAMLPVCEYIVKCCDALLKALPENIRNEVMSRGVLLSGGGALTGGLDELFREKLNIPVTVSPAALECSIEGLGLIIENKDTFISLVKGPEEYVK
ncbi:MAG: rod shape-determining protein [Clostridia bacterium]|nr:rod shape-determining protein [Clostridia bacterium]